MRGKKGDGGGWGSSSGELSLPLDLCLGSLYSFYLIAYLTISHSTKSNLGVFWKLFMEPVFVLSNGIGSI